MPVRAIIIHTTTDAYSVSCNDCKEWSLTFYMKHNADNAMLGHRILKHSYRDIDYTLLDSLRKAKRARLNKI